MLPVGSAFLRPFAGYAYPKPKRRPYTRRRPSIWDVIWIDNITTSDTIVLHQIRKRTVTDSVTIADVIAFRNAITRITVTQSATVSQTINSYRVHTESITQSATVSDAIAEHTAKAYFVSVSHEVTTGQIVKQNRALILIVSHSVTTEDQIVFLGTVISDHLTVTDSIGLLRVLHMYVSHNVTVSDSPFINSPRVLSIIDAVQIQNFYAPRLATVRLNLSDSLTLQDFISARNSTYHISQSDSVSINQFVRVFGLVTTITVSDTISINDKVNTVYSKIVQSDVSLSQHIVRHRYTTQTFTTTNTISTAFARDLNYTITTPLELASDLTRSIIVTREFENPQSLSSTYNPSLYITTKGPHPVVSGVDIIYSYLTLLESAISSLVLPVPELNDSQKQNDTIDIKRTMSGEYKAYVKKSTTEQLTYTWMLDYDKAREFVAWIKVNMTQKIRVTNWKGEIWYGNIINDDFQIKAETKYAGKGKQKTSATLHFEGIKING